MSLGLPIKRLLPSLFVILAVVQIGTLYLFNTITSRSDALATLESFARQDVTHLSTTLKNYLKNGDTSAVKLEIALKASSPNVNRLLIFTESQQIIASYPLEEQYVSVQEKNFHHYHEIEKALSRSGANLYFSECEKIGDYVVLAPFEVATIPGEESQLYVILIEYSLKGFLHPIQESSRKYTLIIVFTTLITTVIVFLYTQKRITERVLHLTDQVQEYASGNFTARSNLSGNDEFGQLAFAFNEMADKLEQNKAQLFSADSELKLSEQRFQQIFDHMPLIGLELNKEGKIEYANPYLCSLLGYSGVDLVGKDWLGNFLPVEEKERISELFQSVINRDDTSHEEENWIVCKGGKQRLIRWINISLPSTIKNSVSVISIGEDITERKRDEEKRFRAQRLESLGQLAGGIAHDFNNILASLFGYLELSTFELKKHNYSQVHEYLSKSLTAFDRAKALALQLLTFSKGGAPLKRMENFSHLVKETVEFALCGTGVEFVFQCDKTVPYIALDRNQIAQVIENLTINARESMGGYGIFFIKISRDEHHVIAQFSDSGKGIPPEKVDSIFDPFYTTKEFGNGLGLATSFSIISQHQGSISVTETSTRGTTFELKLPIEECEDDSDLDSPVKPELHESLSLKILVVDDEILLLDLFNETLSRAGAEITTCSDSVQAKGLFEERKRQGNPFDAVILDLTMPGKISGITLAEQLKKIDPALLLYVTSGFSEDPVVISPESYGFTRSLVKPFQLTKLNDFYHQIVLDFVRK